MAEECASDRLPEGPARRGEDLLCALALLSVGIFVGVLAWSKLASVDSGYHVAYGRYFLEHRRIVDVDPYLYPENARPFINANWGAQVLMALAERLAGAAGLAILRTLLIASAFVCAAILVRDRGMGRLGMAVAWLLMATAAYERFSERPELFSYAIMAAILLMLVRGLRSWKSVLIIGLLQIVWVNLHSYFLVGLMLTGAALAGELVGRLWSRGQGLVRSPEHGSGPAPSLEHSSLPLRSDVPGKRRLVRLLAAALVVQIAACFVNPWHYHGAIFPIRTLRYLKERKIIGGEHGQYESGRAWSAISEFHSPFSFVGEKVNARTIRAYFVVLALAGLGAAAAAATGRLGECLVILVMALMSTQMRRNIAQFAVIAVPPALSALWAVMLRAGISDRRAGRWRAGTAIAVTLLAGWWSYGVVSGGFYYSERRINREFGMGFSERIFPRAATEWLAEQADLQPNLFVDDFASSNTLFWLPDRFKLFVDTNTFAYDEATLALAFDVGLGRIDHASFFDKHGVNVVLLRCSAETQMLVRRLQADGQRWALVYFDRSAVVFARRIAPHHRLIAANEKRPEALDAGAWLAAFDEPAAYKALSLGTAANVPMALGWDDPARRLLEEAVRLAPDYDEAWYNLGVCNGNVGNTAARAGRYPEARQAWQEALRCFEQTLALAPDNAAAAEYLRQTRQRLELLDERLNPRRSPS